MACRLRWRTIWYPLAQLEADAAQRMDELWPAADVHLLAQPGDMHVDDVVEGCGALHLVPDVPRQHLAGNDLAFMSQQVFEKLKFAAREFDHMLAAVHLAGHQVHFEIVDPETQNLVGPPTAD